MNLAAVLVVCLANLFPAGTLRSPAQAQGSASAPQAQAPPAAAPASAAPAGQPQSSPSPATSPKPHRRHKKTGVPDCTTAPAAPSSGDPANAATPGTATKTAGDGTPPAATSTATKPCPPPIVVIRNGGSNEPTVQLKGDATAEQASQERSTTGQLTAASEENLKKIAGHPLSSSQQDTVNQIKDFLEQSRKAIAAGDLERGHNLAMKARLLSDELVKP
jgi:hypothetical protein